MNLLAQNSERHQTSGEQGDIKTAEIIEQLLGQISAEKHLKEELMEKVWFYFSFSFYFFGSKKSNSFFLFFFLFFSASSSFMTTLAAN